MSNVLLVEPSYRSKFPPLGLMRIASYHKERGDLVTFVRGKDSAIRDTSWHRVYISSLFTYELPRTVETVKYYSISVETPSEDIIVGGIGATLLPNYIREKVACKVVAGPLDKPNMLDPGSPPISTYLPDYSMLGGVDWQYRPEDAYFVRVTVGCVRNCTFCAVPVLEPKFAFSKGVDEQIREVQEKYGEKRDLVVLDNNILANDCFEDTISQIREAGFQAGAKLLKRKRFVDFNQGIDARLVTPEVAKLLSSICLTPVRLAFDFEAMAAEYRRAIHLLAGEGFIDFTNYVMFNFNDTPESLYNRMSINIALSQQYGIRITSFPMRFIPINDVSRKFVSKKWYWRYLRGIQCVLNATHGMVSPNPTFFEGAFGSSFAEFLEILAMPDHYILYREKYKNKEADDWKGLYRRLSESERNDFLLILERLNGSKSRKSEIKDHKKYQDLLEHYYPNGNIPHG